MSPEEPSAVYALIDVRDKDGREWTAGVLMSPLVAKDGSGDLLDPSSGDNHSLAVTAFRVVTP